MDFKKLDNLNGHYIRSTHDKTLAAEVIAFLAREAPPRILNEMARSRLEYAMPALKERAKTIVELCQRAEFLFTDGRQPLDAAAEKLLGNEARVLIGKVLPVLEATDWSPPALETAARSFADAAGTKLGQIAQPLRAALTGMVSSPPLFEMMAVLGRTESLKRLRAYSA